MEVTRKAEEDDRIEMEEDDLRRFNFHSGKVPWPRIGKLFNEFNEEIIFEGRNVEEYTYIFIEIIKTICLEIIPRKKQNK